MATYLRDGKNENDQPNDRNNPLRAHVKWGGRRQTGRIGAPPGAVPNSAGPGPIIIFATIDVVIVKLGAVSGKAISPAQFADPSLRPGAKGRFVGRGTLARRDDC